MGFLEDLKAITEDETDDVLYGYEDRSVDGEATQRLRNLSPEDHKLLGRFVLTVPLPRWHADFYIPDLVSDFLERAPKTPDAPVWDRVIEEYKASMDYMALYTEIGKMPHMIFEKEESVPFTDIMDLKRHWNTLGRTADAQRSLTTMTLMGAMLDQELRLREARMKLGWVPNDDIL